MKNPWTCFEGPFGEVVRATGPMAKANPFRFSTKYQDDETDLVYYGYRYYNPSTGRWASQDPLVENGGLNLYVFVGNKVIGSIDRLGLMELWFERNGRRLVSGLFSGDWSQPRGFGEGAWTATDTSLSSWIHLWSGPTPSGVCNTTSGTLTYPDTPGDHENTNPNLGAFSVVARDRCGGAFRIYFDITLVAKAAGKEGGALAKVWMYGRGEASVNASLNVPIDTKYFGTFVDVTLSKEKKTIIQYSPFLSFSTTLETPLKESEGWAFGSVDFIGFNRL